MTTDIDGLIDEALDAEERELLRTLDEPGFFRQAFGIFGGPGGWMVWVMMFWQAAMFIAGVWAAWHFFQASDTVTQLRWGLPAMLLLIFAGMLKTSLMPRMESNRVLRELKRLELQLPRAGRSEI